MAAGKRDADAERPPWYCQLAITPMFPLVQIIGSLAMTAVVVAKGSKRQRSLLAAYLAWICVDPSPNRGGYSWAWKAGVSRWLRSNSFWRVCSRYFPVKLERTAAIPADEGPYIFVCHPHGIIGVAPMTHFGTNATGFEELFPEIPVHLLGHSQIFRVPFFREWALLHGHGTVDRSCCVRLLGQKHSIALAPGGAKESLLCTPGTMQLLLLQRKGFAKMALRTGASLVPVISFGENEVYRTVQFQKQSVARRLQARLQSICGFALPVFWGRKLLPLLPRPTAITTIVGGPVRPPASCTCKRDPSIEEIDEFHGRYCDALKALFEEHKASHGSPDMQLVLV
eukprot:TRINITY_DN53963_c0_g1_i1.p1 TRINITY_DN53963_c0_g1~~TRINITY_DN53963_c0_g1_i1.p1  ORF type:complete len:355 (-),score=33.96 TRINITY_DN53963_c0_g1_i1:13-1032(-)